LCAIEKPAHWLCGLLKIFMYVKYSVSSDKVRHCLHLVSFEALFGCFSMLESFEESAEHPGCSAGCRILQKRIRWVALPSWYQSWACLPLLRDVTVKRVILW